MNKQYILSIDCGTQSLRAIIFNRRGNAKAREKIEYEPYFSNYPGWAEQEPELYWKTLITACKNLKIKHPVEWENIVGVSLTTQRDTVVNIDRNGKVLRPAVLWLDQRMAKCEKTIPLWKNMIFSSIGMRKTVEISSKKSVSNWIRENQAEIWDRTYKYLLLSGYLNYKLSGNIVDSIASQIGHIPFDYKNKKWLKPSSLKWQIFNVEEEKLSELIESGEILGRVTKIASEQTGIKEGLPIISAGSDKGCETLASVCLNMDRGSISFGTTATIQTTSDYYFEPIKFFPSYPAVIPGYYNPEIEIFRGYWMINWFKKEFSTRELIEAKEKNIPPEELLNDRLKEVPPGSLGLVLQPYWGAGLKMPEAKGAIIGFGDVHTRVHIYRAIIEGINYALFEGLEKIERKSGRKIRELIVTGGGSRSDIICQITSDMFNRTVYRGKEFESSALGAAITGFVALGIYKSFEEAVKEMVHYSKIFEPEKENARIYNDLYTKVYKKIYPCLKGIYKDIKNITNYPDI
jgi:sugar (pentulose or hexulose) kinase